MKDELGTAAVRAIVAVISTFAVVMLIAGVTTGL